MANSTIDAGAVANLARMPFKDNCFDKIVSRMVVEHLEDPGSFFQEASRTLKPRGELIILTPNKYGLVTMLARLVPNSLRSRILERLTGEAGDDVFPTYYRANTIRSLDKLASESGMRRDRHVMCQPAPFAFVFSRLICLLSIFYFRLISRYECLAFLRGAIVVRYAKDERGSRSG
jgi:SAM-dependent methyltransferase